jgi:dTDP-4-amino-4,6-dideoxy-D-galactose acyltransferase
LKDKKRNERTKKKYCKLFIQNGTFYGRFYRRRKRICCRSNGIPIKQIEFKYLYNLWVDNSINGKFADGILVYKDQNSILGFVTYKTNQDVATIGLIAVNPKYQGRGIGRKLIQSLENKLAIIGVATVKIPTQLQNEMACGFYTKMGYQLIDSTILKHFWKL